MQLCAHEICREKNRLMKKPVEFFRATSSWTMAWRNRWRSILATKEKQRRLNPKAEGSDVSSENEPGIMGSSITQSVSTFHHRKNHMTTRLHNNKCFVSGPQFNLYQVFLKNTNLLFLQAFWMFLSNSAPMKYYRENRWIGGRFFEYCNASCIIAPGAIWFFVADLGLGIGDIWSICYMGFTKLTQRYNFFD